MVLFLCCLILGSIVSHHISCYVSNIIRPHHIVPDQTILSHKAHQVIFFRLRNAFNCWSHGVFCVLMCVVGFACLIVCLFTFKVFFVHVNYLRNASFHIILYCSTPKCIRLYVIVLYHIASYYIGAGEYRYQVLVSGW